MDLQSRIGHKIKELRENKHLSQTQLALSVGYKDKTAIAKVEAGKVDLPQSKILAFAKALNITPADLLDDNIDNLIVQNIEADNIEKKGLRIPVLGSVPAGVPIEAIEDIIDYEEIDSVTASKGEYFGLKVKGHSMEPRICEGDVLIVKKQDDCESGDTVIVMVNGNDATVKRLMKYADGIRLIPNNPTYEPMYFTNEEIINKPVKIIGKVVENRQKY